MKNRKPLLICFVIAATVTSCIIFGRQKLENSFIVRVSTDELISQLSVNKNDNYLLEALRLANEAYQVSDEEYITLFGRAYSDVTSGADLAPLFITPRLRSHINSDYSNEEVLSVLKRELGYTIDDIKKVLESRFVRHGIYHFSMERAGNSDTISIGLPAVEDPDRLRNLIEARAKVGIWDTYGFDEIYSHFFEVNKLLFGVNISDIKEDLRKRESHEMPGVDKYRQSALKSRESLYSSDLSDFITGNITPGDEPQFKEFAIENPLFAFLIPNMAPDERGSLSPVQGPVVGFTYLSDTAMVNYLLNQEQAKSVLPQDLRLLWGYKPIPDSGDMMQLFAIRVKTNDGSAILNEESIIDADPGYGKDHNAPISISLNREGTRLNERLTRDNIGRNIAIVLDDHLLSAPRVNNAVSERQFPLMVQFATVEERYDIANLLASGSLPIAVTIVKESILKE